MNNAASGNNEKKKIAMYWAASCGGCDISLLEIGPKILDLIQIADVVFWPCVTDFKYRDVASYPDGYIDWCFFNGSIRNSEQEQIARLLRKKSKTLIAYGSCAHGGGIPALANLKDREGILKRVYEDNPSIDNPRNSRPQVRFSWNGVELELPEFYEQVLTLRDIVPVDYVIPGCPPQAERVWEAIEALASGAVPERNNCVVVGAGDKSVCDECTREKRLVKISGFKRPHEVVPEPDWCLLEQGIICMGPATRSGCGALCVNAGLPCRGCYGPAEGVEDQGAAMIGALGALLDAKDEKRAQELLSQLSDPTGTFYRFCLASGHLKARQVRGNGAPATGQGRAEGASHVRAESSP